MLCIEGEGDIKTLDIEIHMAPGTVVFIPADVKTTKLIVKPATTMKICEAYVS